MNTEEYLAWEQNQQNKWQEPRWEGPLNCENWKVSRYTNNPHRYFVTAREELGTQLKVYADMGQWRGGSEYENRIYEELQYYYRRTEGLRIARTRVFNNLSLYEIQDLYKEPKTLCAVINHEKILTADVKLIKDGCRYTLF